MGVRSTVDLLRQIPLFAEVDAPHLQTLAFSSDELVVPARHMVFQAGDPASSAIIIKSGEGVVHDGQTGGVLALAGPGSMFGDLSMIAGLPRQVTLNAKTEIVATVIEQSVFLRLCEEYPEVGMRVLSVLTEQLGRSSEALSAVQQIFDTDSEESV